MKLLLLLTLISLCLLGCASSTQKDAGDADTTAADKTPSRPPQAIAPGTANVSATVLGYEERDHHYLGTLRIEQVDAYGAGTPPLPVGTEIDVVISKALFQEDPDGSKAAAMLAPDQPIAVTLKHQKAAQTGDAPPASWRAIALR